MDDKDRTIRYQQTLIEKLETEIDRTNGGAITPTIEQVDTTNSATQTERVRIHSGVKSRVLKLKSCALYFLQTDSSDIHGPWCVCKVRRRFPFMVLWFWYNGTLQHILLQTIVGFFVQTRPILSETFVRSHFARVYHNHRQYRPIPRHHNEYSRANKSRSQFPSILDALFRTSACPHEQFLPILQHALLVRPERANCECFSSFPHFTVSSESLRGI